MNLNQIPAKSINMDGLISNQENSKPDIETEVGQTHSKN